MTLWVLLISCSCHSYSPTQNTETVSTGHTCSHLPNHCLHHTVLTAKITPQVDAVMPSFPFVSMALCDVTASLLCLQITACGSMITAPHALQCNKNIVVELRIHYLCTVPQRLAQWDANSKDSSDRPTVVRECKLLQLT